MTSFVYDIGDKDRQVSRLISAVRSEIQRAVAAEKARRKLTQQEIASKLGINRSVVNRQIMGYENLTLRSVAELLWAIGDWTPSFEAIDPRDHDGENQPLFMAPAQDLGLIISAPTKSIQAGSLSF